MNKRLITNSIRTIKKSFSKFLPFMVMSFLGVFVFAGLKSTKSDMLNSLDNFLDDYNVYDFKIVSTLGLTNNDLSYLKELDNINEVEYAYSKDVLIKDKEEDYVINVSSLPKNINVVKLVKGVFPENDKEIVVEENFLNKTNYEMGSIINIDTDELKNKEYKIVGVVKSGLYFNNDRLNQDRGSTKVGNGTINFYTFVLDSSFNMDYYSSIYITINDTKEDITSSNDYLDKINKVDNYLNKIKDDREAARYEEIYKEIEDKIKEEELEGNNKLNKAKKELTRAKNN